MIPLRRPRLEGPLAEKLARRTARLSAEDATAEAARRSWQRASAVRKQVKALLQGMSAGLARCMYCGDSQGTDIDHFVPIALAPARTFLWDNLLLACAHCNSNEKRERFPRDDAGASLLIDPTAEEPHDHLRLSFMTGEYFPRSGKGAATIDVFGLNRWVLQRGREAAYARCKSMLRDWVFLRAEGNEREARRVEESLGLQPFADVLHAMRHTPAPVATTVFGVDVSRALRSLDVAATSTVGLPEPRSVKGTSIGTPGGSGIIIPAAAAPVPPPPHATLR
ncbi:HNH endonuclease [Allostreptomyces psammosilenae]|uniref:Uncharacterized protein (TIGR02646 family) n=1 Tax=Allostreptomyces psammosilenae TaxID=1892865 RepID=A0A853A2V1_9ACTN|nr:HNH endonuclease [Allostreptomyces psammosilenae]NYI07800.1 uncharacterized protein (TIGR02646 family) [Allostreptomyces psammosilenae]